MPPTRPEIESAQKQKAKSRTAGEVGILFLGSNPTNTSRIRADREMREIEKVLRQGEHRDRFRFHKHMAVCLEDIQEGLLRYSPDIVHISGHGKRGKNSEDEVLVVEAHEGTADPVRTEELARLFAVFSDTVRCVVLNICWGSNVAARISREVDCVIGMAGVVSDEDAIAFSGSFYSALAYGRDLATAFELGCVHFNSDAKPKIFSRHLLEW